MLLEEFKTHFSNYKNTIELDNPLTKVKDIGNFEIYMSPQHDGFHYYSIKKNIFPIHQLETPFVFQKPLDFLDTGVIFGKSQNTGHILSWNPEGFFESIFSDEELVNMSHL